MSNIKQIVIGPSSVSVAIIDTVTGYTLDKTVFPVEYLENYQLITHPTTGKRTLTMYKAENQVALRASETAGDPDLITSTIDANGDFYATIDPFLAVLDTLFGALPAGLIAAPVVLPFKRTTLAGAVVKLVLVNETFLDSTLSAANFTLTNAPSGVTVGSVAYVSPGVANLTIAYNGTVFGADVPNFKINIAAAELKKAANVTSGNILLSAL